MNIDYDYSKLMFINNGVYFPPSNTNEIFYVIKSSCFNYFYDTIFPKINNNFTILCVGDDDSPGGQSIAENVRKILNSDLLIKCYILV